MEFPKAEIAPYFVIGIVFSGLSMEDVKVSQFMTPLFSLMMLIELIIFVLFWITPPDIDGIKAETGERLGRGVWSFLHLRLEVISIFFYVEVEVAILLLAEGMLADTLSGWRWS